MILSVIIVSLGVVSFFLFSLLSKRSSPKEASGNHFNQALSAASAALQERWTEGDSEGGYAKGSFACPDLISNNHKIHSSYFQCNPYYLLCHLRGEAGVKEPLSFKNKAGEFQFEFLGHGFDRKGALTASFKEKSSGKKASFKFLDTCSQVALPASVYSAGPLEASSLLWDNIGQKVMMDKSYVTNGEARVWLKSESSEKLKNKMARNSTEFHKPSVNLSFKERKLYCAFKGGQLLQSRQFDAATFLPSRGENRYIYKFPYPWTKRKDGIEELGEKNCSKIFSKECGEQNYEFHSTYSPSWSGVYHSLGSYPESFDNKFRPKAIFKPSSKELPLESPWHRLGLRASLENQEELYEYNGARLDLPEQARDMEKRSAFRCVYYY
ncbi:MAG: hypothetical protein WD025_02210 [Bacteriovoracaceae bacterium]